MLVNETQIRKNETVVHVIVFTCLLVVVLMHSWKNETTFSVDDYVIRLYIVLALIALSIVRISSFLSIYGLFFITSNAFICGRFYAYLFLDTVDPFSSPVSLIYYPSDPEKARLMYYLILSFIVVHLGYLLEKCLFNYESLPEKKSDFVNWLYENKRNIVYVFYTISLVYMILTFKALAGVFASGSYLGLYEFQGEEYSTSVVAVFKVVFMFLFGMVFSIGDKGERRIALAIAVTIGIAYFLIGTRSSLISSILFIVWYFHNYERKISFFKVALAGVLVVALSQYLIALTLRGSGLDGVVAIDPVNLFAFFLYDQGISLMVYEFSLQFSDWPLLTYFQSIFPGTNALLKLFGITFESQYANIGSYLSYQVNPAAFVRGNALGWTMFGDFAVYSFQTIGGYIFVGGIWGAFMSFLESCSKRKVIVRALALSIFTQIVISPRGGFGSVFPVFFYYVLFWILLYFLWKRISVVKGQSSSIV